MICVNSSKKIFISTPISMKTIREKSEKNTSTMLKLFSHANASILFKFICCQEMSLLFVCYIF